VIMMAVFSIFASLHLFELKMLGVGLPVAVLVDATVVRGVLLPAAMSLLGDRCWYLPRRRPAGPARSRRSSRLGDPDGSPVLR
jgi:putative drug exporter of the RND superfamily